MLHLNSVGSKVAFECFIEDRREHGIQLGAGLDLKRLHFISLGLQGIEFCDDLVLMLARGQRNGHLLYPISGESGLCCSGL